MSSFTDLKDIALLSIIIGAATLLLKRQPERRWWVKPWLNRKDRGNLYLVNKELEEDTDSYNNFLRMDKETFEKLLDLIKEDIQKEHTFFRASISARDRLIITLRYLATGETYKSLQYSFRVAHSTISIIVPEVCGAICQRLKKTYLKVPNTCTQWLNIAEDFEKKWNMPNTLGAMDGKHILIQAPRGDGSLFFNYKGGHSIVLLALVDANYKFLYVDVGRNGRISDGGIFRRSTLSTAIARNSLNFPDDNPLPGRNKSVPYVIVADAAFPLSHRILKPYPFQHLTWPKRIFNYRLSRARRVVENAFGILANRFRILLNKINLGPEKAELVTLTCVVLHNFLRTECPEMYQIRDESDVDRRYLLNYGFTRQAGNRSARSALDNRLEFLEYVNSAEGAVTWQNDLA